MPGRIPEHWKDRPTPADLIARDRRMRANARFLEHAKLIHGIELIGSLRVQRTRLEHMSAHERDGSHSLIDHYYLKGG